MELIRLNIRVSIITGLILSSFLFAANPKFSLTKLGGNSGQLGDRESHSQLSFGPDGHLYATRTLPGQIWRYKVDNTGVIVEEELLMDEVVSGSGINGFVFDLKATPQNLTFYYSKVHNGGQVYRVKIGPWGDPQILEQTLLIDDIQIMGNHAINNMTFGPGDKLFITLSGQDHTGWTGEKLWTGSIGEVNLEHPAFNNPPVVISAIDVQDQSSPINLFVTGVRNGQGLLYHSNGYLYGTSHDPPATGTIPHPSGVGQIDNARLSPIPDLVTRYERGKYYGHTNPSRGQNTYYGGNPTAGVDPYEVPDIPVGTPPDPNFDFKLMQGTDLNMCIAAVSEFTNGNLMVTYMKERGISKGFVEWFDLDDQGYFTNPDPYSVIGNHNYIQNLAGEVIEFGGVFDVEVVPENSWIYVADWGLRAGDAGAGEIAGIYLLKPEPGYSAVPKPKTLSSKMIRWTTRGIEIKSQEHQTVSVKKLDFQGRSLGKIFTGKFSTGINFIEIPNQEKLGVSLYVITLGGNQYYLKTANIN